MWSDFDGKKGTLTVRRTLHQRKGGGVTTGETKTGKGRRTITLPPSTAQLLRERQKRSCSQWIFPNPLRPEDPVNPGRAYSRLKTLLKRAGLPGIRFHDLPGTALGRFQLFQLLCALFLGLSQHILCLGIAAVVGIARYAAVTRCVRWRWTGR